MDGDSAWGIKPGAASWADDIEEAELKHGPLRDEEAFPTLGAAVQQKDAKSGKKGGKAKPVKLGLGEFLAAPARRSAAESDKEILMKLPKSSSGLPREERDPSALGGAFKDYGGERGGFRRGDRGDREEREPSRADASGDWGKERKFTPSTDSDRRGGFGGGGFRDRDGGFGERRGGFGDRPPREDRPVSEADQVSDWGANRKFTPSAESGRGGGFGSSGFSRDREGGSFRDRPRYEEGSSRADEGDWGRRAGPPPGATDQAGQARRGYGFSEAPVSQADLEDRWSHRGPPPAATGPSRDGPAAAAPERPRLKLQPRSKPLESAPAAGSAAGSEGAAEGVSPHSEAGSTGSAQQQQSKKSNPFGAARPREEVLKEKGIDYQKEQLKLEHGEVIRDKTSEEADMEEEVEELRVRLEGLKELTPGETDTISELAAELDEKEKALYKLQAELDDKVRFSKNRPQERERSADPAARGSSAAANGDVGFVEVRNPRKERTAAQPDGAAPAAERSDSGGAWGRGGSFSRDRDGGRGGSFKERDNREGRGGGRGGDREGRDRERPAAPGRSGW